MEQAYARRSPDPTAHASAEQSAGNGPTHATPASGLALYALGTDEAADRTVESLGGFQSLDELYSADFTDGYHQLVAQYELVTSRARDLAEQLPPAPRLEIRGLLDGAEALENALYGRLWTHLTGAVSEPDESVLDLYRRLDVAVELVRAMSDLWAIVLGLQLIDLLDALGTGWVLAAERLQASLAQLEAKKAVYERRLAKAQQEHLEAIAQLGGNAVLAPSVVATTSVLGLTNPWLTALLVAGGGISLDHFLGASTATLETSLSVVTNVTSGFAAGFSNDKAASEAWRAGWRSIGRSATAFGAALDANEIRTTDRNLQDLRAAHAAFRQAYEEAMRVWEETRPFLTGVSRQLELLHRAAQRGRSEVEIRQVRIAALRSCYGDALFRLS